MVTIYTGKENMGSIPNVKYLAPEAMEMLATIEGGNTQDVQNLNRLNQLLSEYEIQVPRIDGTPIPVEEFNLYFTKGTIQSGAPEFRPYLTKFDMVKSEGYNVVAYNYDGDTIAEARNNGLNLMSEALRKVQKAQTVYTNKYLPYHRLHALLNGNTQSSSLPAYDGGTGIYSTSFGWARGEDFSGFVPSTSNLGTTRNHYRVIADGAGIAETDISTCVELIEETDKYSGEGIIALAHSATINRVGQLFADTANYDDWVLGEIYGKPILGATFVEVPQMDRDFILFLDRGSLSDIIINGINKDEAQRGWGLFMMDNFERFQNIEDINGAKLRIFSEERYVANRLAGCILDVDTTRADAGGVMADGGDSEIALEAFIAKLVNGYSRSE